MIPADRQNIKWKSKCSNTCIINSIRHNICSCPEQCQKWFQEHQYNHSKYQTTDCQWRQRSTCNPASFLLLSCPHFQIIIWCTANSQKQCQRSCDRCNRKRHICSCISQHPHTLSNKNLIHDIIHRTDQHTDDRRNRKLHDQSTYRCYTKRILCLRIYLLRTLVTFSQVNSILSLHIRYNFYHCYFMIKHFSG